jgi:hypothetical protein
MSNWKKWVWPMLVSGCLVGLVTVGLSQSPPEKDGGDKPGRYQAVSVGGTVILLDTATGKTWRTQGAFGFPGGPAGPGGHEEVWVPMTKFDTMEAYQKWRQERERKMFGDKGPTDVFPKDAPFKDKLPFPPFKDKGPFPPFKDKGPPLFKDKLPGLDKGQPGFERKLD